MAKTIQNLKMEFNENFKTLNWTQAAIIQLKLKQKPYKDNISGI